MDVLEDYLDGKLDARSMHQVEKHALEDPFVAEALAGLSASPKRSLQSLSLLQQQLQDRIAGQTTHKKKSIVTWQRLSIAAAAAVMFISVSIVFWMKNNTYTDKMAGQPKKVEVTLAPKESAVVAASPKPSPAVEGRVSTTETQVKADGEVDKAIAAAKSNTYAAVRPKTKKRNEQSMEKMAAPVVAAMDVKDSAIKPQGYAMARSSKMAVSSPEPEGGYENYSTYVAKNKRLQKNEENPYVLLSFRVNEQGKAIDFKVLSRSAKEYAEEAIRLVKEGPVWVLPKQGTNETTLQIDF